MSQQDRKTWFNDARFGLFIHWGPYAVPGRGEWVRWSERIPDAEYRRFADDFTAAKYDPLAWANLAKAGGARYVVLTTRHHDGFCLWDSDTTDFTAAKTAAGRDLLRPFVDACRAAGLGVGLYYSIKDWSVPAYFAGPDADPAAWAALVDRIHAQVRELMSNYGLIDILWYDGPDDPNFNSYAPREVWRTAELNAMVRALQPGILINGRGGPGGGDGDFRTPEQEVPMAVYQEGVFESCVTMTDRHWGYAPLDHYKTTPQLLAQLISCAARGGNYLLNVGPDAAGTIPAAAVERLEQIGHWLSVHGEAIYGTQKILPNWWDFTSTGRITTRDHTAYLIIERWPENNAVAIGQLANVVLEAQLLANRQSLTIHRDGHRVQIRGLPTTPPAWPFNVIRLTLDGPATPQFFNASNGR